MVVIAPGEIACTAGTLNPFWPMPPSEMTGISGDGGFTGSVIVAVNVAVKAPDVAVIVSVPAFVGVAATPAWPLTTVADPPVTANVTLTLPAGRPVFPVNLTIIAFRVAPVTPVWLLPLTISILT